MPTTAELQAYAVQAAQREGVPVNTFLWQIGQESGWNPNAKNPLEGSTSGGLGGFIDPTAKAFGIDKYNPYQALDAAAKYDAQLYKQTGSWEGALTKYGTLADASPQVKAAFGQALAKDANRQESGVGGLWQTVKDGTSKVWDNSMFGLASDTYNNLTGNGKTSGSWNFDKMLSSGTFIVLGIVVIALAILSNKQVQQAVATVATKGAA